MESERCGVTNCRACHSSCYCDQFPLVSGVWSATPRVTASSRHRRDEARRIDLRSVPPGPGAADWISTPHGGRPSSRTAETGQDHSNTSPQHRRDKSPRIDIWSVPPDPEDVAPISTPHSGHTSCGTAETGQDHSNDGACRPMRHAPLRSRLAFNAARRSTPEAEQAESTRFRPREHRRGVLGAHVTRDIAISSLRESATRIPLRPGHDA